MLGFVDRVSAVAALDNAMRLGIRQFDVARSYGYGQAERLLGDFFRSNRSTIQITSKYGISPAAGLRANAIRLLRSGAAGLRHVRFFSDRNAQNAHSAFWSASAIQKSLDQSLTELRTEYLDEFLLHSPPLELAKRDEVFQTLESAKRSGKVRQFGISTDATGALAFLPRVQTVQIGFNLEHRALSQPLQAFSKTIHHVFGGRGGAQRMALRIKEALARRMTHSAKNISKQFEFDGHVFENGVFDSIFADTSQLNEAILRVSLLGSGARAAVVSMNNPKHQALNVNAVLNPVLPDLLIEHLSDTLFHPEQNE